MSLCGTTDKVGANKLWLNYGRIVQFSNNAEKMVFETWTTLHT